MAEQAVRMPERGSEAYNFNLFAAQAAPRRQPKAPPKPNVRVTTSTRRIAKQRNRHVVSTLVMVFMLAVLGALVIGTYAQVGELRAQISAQEEQLNNEKATYTDLVYQLESRTNVTDVEQRATEMGLVKVDKSQVTYIRVADENTIEVQKGPLQMFWEMVVNWLTGANK